jgi:hypothetical protein
MENKSLITQNFVHLVGLYTYCRIMQAHTASNRRIIISKDDAGASKHVAVLYDV